MDPSKLNINPNTRARIREKFFERCPQRQTKATECDSADNKTEEVLLAKEEEPVRVPECRSNVLFAEEDEGFPMITSVFSLATPGTDNQPIDIPPISITAPPFTTAANTQGSQSNDLTSPPTGVLPFVVRCANGVITVSSPPRTTPTYTTSPVTALPHHLRLPPTSNIPSTQPTESTRGAYTSAFSSVKATKELQSKINDACQPADQADVVSQSHISDQLECDTEDRDPCDTITSSDHPINVDYLDIEANSSTITEQSLSEPQSVEDSTESENDVPLVTKHDDRIRRLKDLLRQQENELEKLRFKKKSETLESSSSKSSTSTSSLKSDLRLQLLKNTVIPEFKTPKSFDGEAIQSEPPKTSVAASPSIEKEKRPTQNEKLFKSPTDSKTLPLKRKSIETINKVESSAKRKEITASELRQNLRRCKDKYHLVNVTVVKGHTRTLSVPVNDGNQPTTLLENVLKNPNVTQVVTKRKSVETPERAIKVSKQDATSSIHSEVSAKTGDRGCTTALKVSPSVTPSCNTTSNHTTVVSPNNTTFCAKASTTNQNTNAVFNLMNPSVNSSATKSTVATTRSPTLMRGHLNQATVLNMNNTLYRLSPQANTVTATPVLNTGPINSAVQPSLNQANKVSHFANKSIFFTNSGAINIPSTKTVPSDASRAYSALPIPNTPSLNQANKVSPFANKSIFLTKNGPINIPSTKTVPSDASRAYSALPIPNAPSLNQANKVSHFANKGIVLTKNGAIVNIPSTKTVPSDALYVRNGAAKLTLGNLQKSVNELNASVRANQALTGLNTSPNKNHPQRQLHTIAPKPALITSQAPNPNLNEKVVFYSLPKSVGASGLNNLENRQIIVCNVIQPKRPTNQGKVLLSPIKNDTGNVVVYVTNQGTNPNLGFINDKIIFSTEKPSVTPTTQVDHHKKTVVEKADAEFIPNAEDVDFTKLVGLEHVVQSLNSN